MKTREEGPFTKLFIGWLSLHKIQSSHVRKLTIIQSLL